jgi:hypothetical protein
MDVAVGMPRGANLTGKVGARAFVIKGTVPRDFQFFCMDQFPRSP